MSGEPHVLPLSRALMGVRSHHAHWTWLSIGAGAELHVPRSRAATAYLVLGGEVVIRAGARRDALRLAGGDVAFLLRGPHQSVQQAGAAAGEPVTVGDMTDVQESPARLAFGRVQRSEVLVGRMELAWPRELPPPTLLPQVLVLRAADELDDRGQERVYAVREQLAGAGASAYLTRFAEARLLKALRLYAVRGGHLPVIARDTSEVRCETAIRAVRERLAHPWSVAELAAMVGMSRSTFAARFTAYTGQAPMDFVAEQRLQQAAELLASSYDKVYEIAHLVGYVSDTAFTRRFLQRFGMSPAAYRRRSQTIEEVAELRPGSLAARRANL